MKTKKKPVRWKYYRDASITPLNEVWRVSGRMVQISHNKSWAKSAYKSEEIIDPLYEFTPITAAEARRILKGTQPTQVEGGGK